MKTIRTRQQCSQWGCYRRWFRRVITVSLSSWCHRRSSAPPHCHFGYQWSSFSDRCWSRCYNT